MAPDPSDVKRVLGSTDLSDSEVQAFITEATAEYEAVIGNEAVDADLKDLVITRLAAHGIATGPERQIDSAGEGDGNVKFAGDTGEGLNATTQGQRAQDLDPTGQLGGGEDDESSDHFTFST
ncbi:hypothetical protein HZS55_09175 [Halosimplex rubrum]|uniref:Uncharacterized protein n=1 Tax=Halosimplex rubrum TaxID=869889 RepID=A0A7D5TCP2_9EURY|nr:hypothetical protein [Halosimplex rubrum]QLH77456.1 hypothetical protein HZS55_09175 [Halosimplex rubrum]